MTTVAELIGQRLCEAGVKYVFGHPGGEITDLMEGLRKAGLQFVLTHHEGPAAFAASTLGQYTGVPGVCLSTLAPGATNLVTGVAHAWLDRCPVIAMSAQLPADRYPLCTHQKLDLAAIFAPITKFTANITAANADAVLVKAVRTATEERPGPVYLQIAPDVAKQEVPAGLARHLVHAVQAGAPDAAALQAAAERIRGARRPVLIAGLDAMRAGAADAVRSLAESLGLPVLVGPKAKGVFPENHPLFVGTIEMLGTQKLYDFVLGCDLVLMAGFDAVELDRDWPGPSEIIHIGPLPNSEQYYPSIIDVVGPVRPALEALTRALGTAQDRWDRAEIARFVQGFRTFTHPDVPGLTPQTVLTILREQLPANALVSCDVGNNKSVTGQWWQALQPNTFFMSNGLSSMGYGLPSAIALKLAEPERQVATVLGDGGFGMVMGEIETVARLGLSGLVVIVLEDNSLSMIRYNQERKGLLETGTRFGRTDYVLAASSVGLKGVSVDNPSAFRQALRTALDESGVTIIAARINEAAYRLK